MAHATISMWVSVCVHEKGRFQGLVGVIGEGYPGSWRGMVTSPKVPQKPSPPEWPQACVAAAPTQLTAVMSNFSLPPLTMGNEANRGPSQRTFYSTSPLSDKSLS